MSRPAEITEVHTRILRLALGIEDSRDYWAVPELGPAAGRVDRAFRDYWFGARSHARVELLLANMRARFDAVPEALAVLRAWPDMDPDTRRVVCHWHLQLADPLYRRFSGQLLAQRRTEGRPDIGLPRSVEWVGEQDVDGRWTMSTRLQFAGKLLSASADAGLIQARRDPRPLVLPRVPESALAYLLHLLRSVDFDGTLLDNPYLASVGLVGETLDDRLRTLPGLRFVRQGPLRDLSWEHPSLSAWFDAWRAEHPLERAA